MIDKINSSYIKLMKRKQVIPKVANDQDKLKNIINNTNILINECCQSELSSNVNKTEELDDVSVSVSDSNSNSDDSIDDEYYNNIKRSIQNAKKMNDKNISDMQDTLDNIEEDYINEKCDLDAIRNEKRKDNEKKKEHKRVFETDRDVTYPRIKQSIEEGRMTEQNVPDMFAKRYPIFKVLEIENVLGTENDYNTYCNLYKEMYPEKKENDDDVDNTYVPHNIAYLSEEIQEQYKDHENSDIIDEMINKV